MPHVDVQQLLDGPNPNGTHNYWTADFSERPGEAIDTLVGLATKPVSPMTQLILVPGGGDIARVDEDAMAFGQRSAPFNMHYLSMWPDPADTKHRSRTSGKIAAAMKPWTTGRASTLCAVFQTLLKLSAPSLTRCRAEIEQLVHRYRDGASIGMLAVQYDVHRTTVTAHFERTGIARRRVTRKMTEESVGLAAVRYEAGASLAVVARAFGVHDRTLAREFRRAGVSIRPRRGWRP